MNSKLPKVTPEVINDIRRRIVDAIHPCQIVLFGSQARGDTKDDSDLDMLIVHDTSQADREVRRQVERLFLGRRFGLDVLVRTPEEVAMNLADGNPFYTEHIFGEGIVLYERKASQEAG